MTDRQIYAIIAAIILTPIIGVLTLLSLNGQSFTWGVGFIIGLMPAFVGLGWMMFLDMPAGRKFAKLFQKRR